MGSETQQHPSQRRNITMLLNFQAIPLVHRYRLLIYNMQQTSAKFHSFLLHRNSIPPLRRK